MRIKIFLVLVLTIPSYVFSQPPNLKIGLSLPLSGPLQEYGIAVKNAFGMVGEELGMEGYELVYEDNQFDGKSAVTTFKSLTEVKKVDMIYLWGEVGLYSVAPLSTSKKVPILAMSVDKRSVKNQPYVIRTINPSADFVSTVYAYFRSNIKGPLNIGVIASEDPFFEGLTEGLYGEKGEGESVTILAKVSPNLMDLKAELLRVKAKDVNVLAVYLFPGQVSSAFRTMRNLGIKTQRLVPTFLKVEQR